MAIITISTFKGPGQYQLDARQVQMFENEIRRVRGSWLDRWLTRLAAPKVRTHLTAPDCIIRVEDGGRVTEWELHGRYMLREKGHAESYAFYLGILMVQWLNPPSP